MSTVSAHPIIGVDLLPAPTDAVSVYVHIPFCSSRCNYCDFYFETTRSPMVIRSTLDRIAEEAGFLISSMGRPRVRSVYFGGGTPSLVPPKLLDDFLSRLEPHLFPSPEGDRSGVEWTFEANPESVTEELIEVLDRHGVNRVSLGIQTFDDRLLRTLTRRADHATILEALRVITSARAAPLRLNVDLITGIPGQTKASIQSDVREAVDFGVDHFSVYSLTVEEHTPLRQAVDHKIRLLPSPSQQDGLWLTARDAVCGAGFEWYEISNFSLPGKRSEHNVGYWRLEPYLGLGPGGVSTIPMVPPQVGGPRPVRLTNPNLFIYGSRFDRGWHHEVEELSPKELLFEHFITGLRTSDGVSLQRIEELFGIELQSLWKKQLSKWLQEGIVEAIDTPDARMALAPTARLALDRYLLEIGSWIDALPDLPPPAWPLPNRSSLERPGT